MTPGDQFIYLTKLFFVLFIAPAIPSVLPPVTSTDFRSIPSATQDILPHSIITFQHPAPPQMNFGSFSASTFSSSSSAPSTTPNSFSLNE